jgi:hypothetical protein
MTTSCARVVKPPRIRLRPGEGPNAALATKPGRDAVKAYTDASAELESCIDTLKKMFEETLSKAGETRGMKGPLLERVIGTPIQHFLQCLIVLWREATGRKVLGEKFECIAKEFIEATLPDDEFGNRPQIGDLKRQIENAKRCGEVVQTEWTYKTDVMNDC